MVAGAVLASAAAIAGAVWAVAAIVDDDDYDCCYVDYATSFDFEDQWDDVLGSGPRPDRDRGEKAERRRGKGERYEREWQERPERREQFGRGEREGRHREERHREERHREELRNDKADGSEPSKANSAENSAEECKTVLSLGAGEDAVTVLVCNAPKAEWPEFESDRDRDYFEFRKRPRDFIPFFGMRGEQWPFEGRVWPFGPGMVPGDRDGGHFRDEGFFGDERFFGDGVPFDSEGFFEDGDRGFPFRGDGNENGFCFRQDGGEECLGDFDELSGEEREQLERMMEMLDGLGMGGFFRGLPDFLDEFESEFSEFSESSESRADPSGVTGT